MSLSSKICKAVYDMALPIAESLGCTVYETEYKKEGSDFVLRVVLDTLDDSSVSIDMCEAVSRGLSEELDKNDPISSPYMLEVTSPGLDRPLKKDEDFVRFSGRDVEVGLYKAFKGSKLLCGKLVCLRDGVIIINDGTDDIEIKKEDASFVRLAVIF